MRPARDSQYNVVTQLVEHNDVQEQEDDYEGYLINSELHDMIRGAAQFNKDNVLLPHPDELELE